MTLEPVWFVGSDASNVDSIVARFASSYANTVWAPVGLVIFDGRRLSAT